MEKYFEKKNKIEDTEYHINTNFYPLLLRDGEQKHYYPVSLLART